MAGFDEDVEDVGRRIDQDFTHEEWRFKAKMISSEFRDKIGSLIGQYDFSMSCKIHHLDICNVAFDPNAMLARNLNVETRKKQLGLALNLAIVACDESDIQNPGFINVQQAIIDAFGDFVSPSQGGKERERITKQESVTHSSYSGLPGEGSANPKRGFKLPWRREE
jgi:hypothetical protein